VSLGCVHGCSLYDRSHEVTLAIWNGLFSDPKVGINATLAVANYIGRGEDGTRDPTGNQEYLDDIGEVGYHAFRRYGPRSLDVGALRFVLGGQITCKSEKNLRRTLWRGVRVAESGCY
jgi:hypothetical protein